MKIAALSWRGNNIGDDIQTIAVMQHLPPVDLFLNREDLHAYDGPECLLVMNGWFMDHPDRWPPSAMVKPVFFGFHITGKFRDAVARHVDYLKKHEPIGCRDRGTMEFLRSLGVRAYLSLCATLTFDGGEDRKPRDIYYVEAERAFVHKSIRRFHGLEEKRVSHRFIDVPHETRLAYARNIVETYRRNAAMVVTSRIHCAMPCVAMGIPVAFFGPIDYRTQVLEEIGLTRRLPLQEQPLWKRERLREWPKPLDISATKTRIRDDLRSRIRAALAGDPAPEMVDAATGVS